MSATKELTNDLLKEKMTDAMVYRGIVRVPLEELTRPGYYQISSVTPASELSYFSGAGSLPQVADIEVMTRGVADIIQRITETSGVPNILMRVQRLGVWGPWYKVAVTLLS